ncbi:peroxisomal membrane protein PEX16 [Anabrus simplex]|uniref:peroxisomal membrane protein PEX16 n=1 Tax=Anabrus simplex TaxID=316456 RepID=UPI0035A3597F
MSLIFSLPELYSSYRNWVSKNPQLAGDLESTAKWISYFIAGRINNSNVLSEFVFSLSNLLVLFNDRIIHSTRITRPVRSGEVVKLWLTVLEYSEVFVEITARKLWGSRGKWIVVVLIQLVKCVGRLGLLLYHKERIIQNPPIAPLRRKEITDKDEPSTEGEKYHSIAFTLKRSGRVIRTVNSAPPVHCRTWKPPVHPSGNNLEQDENYKVAIELTRRQLTAEVLYIGKPLIHLAAMYRWGQKAWKPWLVSLGVDLLSLHLYSKESTKLTRLQRLELSRRSVALLLYLLRSPYYDRYTRDRLQTFLRVMAKNVPLVGIVCTPLAQYIPVWQDTYFYMWST